MSGITLKERKYVECFISNRDGSCNHCKMRQWIKGYKIYAMKKPDGKWLACTCKKCYLAQGGKLTLFQSPSMKQPDSCDCDISTHTFPLQCSKCSTELKRIYIQDDDLTNPITDTFWCSIHGIIVAGVELTREWE